MSVSDLMEDQVALDGVLMKCNQDASRMHNDMDCVNARAAIARLAVQREAALQANRTRDFERAREQLRQQQERQREIEAAKTKVDAYHLPLVPVEPVHAPKDPQSPIVGQTAP